MNLVYYGKSCSCVQCRKENQCSADILDGNMPHNVFLPPYSWTESLSGDACVQPMWGEEESAQMYDDGALINIFTEERISLLDDMELYPPSFTPTAVGKSSSVFSNTPQQEWRAKPVKQWTCTDVMNWIGAVAGEEKLELEYVELDRFRIDGLTLWSMSEKEFVTADHVAGPVLYHTLQRHKCDERMLGYDEKFDIKPILPPFHIIMDDVTPTYMNLDPVSPRHQPPSDSEESETGVIVEKPAVKQPPGKRRPGRPPGGRSKRKPEKKTGRLWEFIRNLLHNREYCPSLICWENHDEGVFRFVRSDKVAELWGTLKENPKMTYEKLSRAMRYYYKSKVLQPVLGRRLVYKFGPTATKWRSSDPNFRAALSASTSPPPN